MYVGLHGKYPLFLPDFNENLTFFYVFRKILKCQILLKSVHWEPSYFMPTDGQTEEGEKDRMTLGRTDRETERHDEPNNRTAQFRERS